MKQHRAPALNRFEADLARAIDERTARSTLRRHARLAVLGVLVLAGTTAGVAYAWTRPVHHSSEIATISPDDATTTIPGEPGDAPISVTLRSGQSGGVGWALQLEVDPRSRTCVVLTRTSGNTSTASTCGAPEELEAALTRSPVNVLHLAEDDVFGGNARADVARVDLVDPIDRVVASIATEPDDRVPGGRHWAVDGAAGSTAVIAYGTGGDELGRQALPNGALLQADPERAREAADIQRAAAGAIVGLGTVDPDGFIDDPEGLAARRNALAAAYPEQVGHTTFVMQSLTFTGETEAEFVYDILLAPPIEAKSLHGLVGHAVRIDGVWKVTRATACQAWNWGGGSC